MNKINKSMLFLTNIKFSLVVITGLLLFTANLVEAQNQNTFLGDSALSRLQESKYPISSIVVTSQTGYSLPTFHFNSNTNIQIEDSYVDAYPDFLGAWIFLSTPINSPLDLVNNFPTLIGGHGSGATVYLDDFYDDNGRNYYQFRVDYYGTGYAPIATLSGERGNINLNTNLYSYSGEDERLVILYSDDYKTNTYTIAPTVTVQPLGSANATAVANLSSIPARAYINRNTAVGYQSMKINSTGIQNTAIGALALTNNISGGSNVANGYRALFSNSTGNSNDAFGSGALYFNKYGNQNTAIGDRALYANLSSSNVAVGSSSLSLNTSGDNNSAVGYSSGQSITTGRLNTVLGSNSGIGITTGNNNTILGANVTGLTPNLSNTVILADGQGNKRFYSPASGNVLIGYGNNPTDKGFKLDVDGTAYFNDYIDVNFLRSRNGIYFHGGRYGQTNTVDFMQITYADGMHFRALPNYNYVLSLYKTGDSRFYGRVKGINGIDSDDFITKGQMDAKDTSLVHKVGDETIAGNKNFTSSVGIGTTTPDEKLTVKGTIHAEEVRVDLLVLGPDYVFDKQYRLTPLSEIQKYITANKHLPEIPSAKEMEQKGINLSEMNMLLLKKVEELTLHLIQQEKEIKELKEIVLEK